MTDHHTLLPIHHQNALMGLGQGAANARKASPQTLQTRQRWREKITAIDLLTKSIKAEFPHRYWPVDGAGFTVSGPGVRAMFVDPQTKPTKRAAKPKAKS